MIQLKVIEPSCKDVESISVQPLDEMGSASGCKMDGGQISGCTVRERWTVRACGKEYTPLVYITPSGAAGTFYSLEPRTK